MSWVAPRYAGFWIRVLASLIDSVWMSLFTFVLGFGIFSGLGVAASDPNTSGIAGVLVSFVAPLLLVIAIWRLKQTTPGKAFFGCRIVDAATGTAPSTSQCVIRYLSYFIAAIPLGLGFLWIAVDPRRQGWHDKLARTVVIQDTERATPFL